MSEEKIRILSPLVGGAFGSKSFLWMHVVLMAVAARQIDRRVKLVLTRNQMFSSTRHRPRTQQDITLVCDEDGRIQSTTHHTLTETSTVGHFCEPAGLSSRFLYHSPRMVISHRVSRLNLPTPCFMRGPGEAPGLFALEVAVMSLRILQTWILWSCEAAMTSNTTKQAENHGPANIWQSAMSTRPLALVGKGERKYLAP